jgi:3-(3-hydroxy-phenyl)propionate hydroxylase
VVERDGLFADWMRQHGAAAVIVRPDRYVFGAAGGAGELNMLVEQLLQNLSAGR